MNQATFLLEYLKEHYTQARQHETLRTNSTTLLTAAAGVVIGIAFKDGKVQPQMWWAGIVLILIGLACRRIQEAHFNGNRFHTQCAGLTRLELVGIIPNWVGQTPDQIRNAAMTTCGIEGSVGRTIQAQFRLVPMGIIGLGTIITLGALVLYVIRCCP